MSYLVLARKYRPQTFAEIVGQEHVTQTLANAFAQDRVAHAFLFCGPRGVGKTTAARCLAKALCCEQGPTPTPCGTCSACTTIANGTAVDYFEIDGASNNSVDDVRELRDGVRYQPAQLRRKVYVVDEVHMLSTAAFNALLKTLEEPPPHVTFVFATTEVHKIPVTILSRCQRYDFKLVTQARLVEHLTKIFVSEKIQAERGAVELLAREAGGSVRDMLSLADQVVAYVGAEALTEARVAEVLGVADRALLHALARAVVTRDVAGGLNALDAAQKRGVDLAHLAKAFLGTLRDLTVVSALGDKAAPLLEASPEELVALSQLATQAARPALLGAFDRMARACEELAKTPAPRLLLDVALVELCDSDPVLPAAELIGRLEGLEKRLRAGGSPPGPSSPPRGSAKPTAPAPTVAPTNVAPTNVAPAASTAAPAASAPAPAAPPPRNAQGTPTNAMAAWEDFVATALPKTSLTLAGVFSHAKLVGWDHKGIELGFPPSFEMGSDPQNLIVVKQALATWWGGPLDVKIKTIANAQMTAPVREDDGEEKSSVADVERQRRADDRARREAEARAHPATQAVIDAFGATIKEIKVDG